MRDLDILLKQFDQPAKAPVKEPPTQHAKLPVPVLPTLPKFDFTSNDQRRGPIANPTYSHQSEQRRPSILKQPTKSSTEQSFDIDTILQGRSTQQVAKGSGLLPLGPAKNSASSQRRDSLSDWLKEDRVATKNPSHASNLFPSKVATNAGSKPSLDFNPDDLFSDSPARDHSATKLPTTKTSAKQYYMGNSRYKPGRWFHVH